MNDERIELERHIAAQGSEAGFSDERIEVAKATLADRRHKEEAMQVEAAEGN